MILRYTRAALQLVVLHCFGWLLTLSQGYVLLGNGVIYTMEANKPTAEAVAMEDGKIVGVGTPEEIRESLDGREETEFWDLGGRLVLPGFIDTHLHAVEAGINAGLCFFDEDADLYDFEFYFQDCMDGGAFGDQGWIVGAGVNIATLVQTVNDFNYEYPIDVLDAAFPDTPVLILDNLGHGAVVNSLAMELAGMTNFYEVDPPGGKLDRDPETGDPTGVVRENAQQAFRNKAFPPTAENQKFAYEALLQSMDILAAYGITSVSDAGGFWLQAQTEAWERARANNKMKVRASNAYYVYPDIPMPTQVSQLTSRFSNDKESLVRFNAVKMYVDGILSLGTSALKEPYLPSFGLSEEDSLGFLYFDNELTIQGVADALSIAGYQLHLHVTGDRGVETALNIIQDLPGNNHGPHRLTHCYLIDESDRARFRQLDVIADFQLSPSSLSSRYEDLLRDNILGPERVNELLPAKEMLEANATVTLSSDWDADILSPLSKMKAVLTRSGDKALPDVETVLPLMTINGAKAIQHEDYTGSILTGKFADMIVLSENILELSPEEVDQAEVLVTIMNGERTFDPDGLYGEAVGVRVSGIERLGISTAWYCSALVVSTLLYLI